MHFSDHHTNFKKLSETFELKSFIKFFPDNKLYFFQLLAQLKILQEKFGALKIFLSFTFSCCRKNNKTHF